MRRKAYGGKRRKSWITTHEKVMAALSETWMRNKDLKLLTQVVDSTLALHLEILVDEGIAERWVDAGPGKHPPPTNYRLKQRSPPNGEEASITLRGLTRLRIGSLDAWTPEVYVNGSVTLDEQTMEEVSEMLRKADSILAELLVTLQFEMRRFRLARLIAGVEGFEEVNELKELLDTYLSFEDRFRAAGVASSGEEEAMIRSREVKFLGSRDKSYRDLEPGDRLWFYMNIAWRNTPLTGEGFGALCELRRRMEGLIDPTLLGELLEEPNPAVCLVAASRGVRVASESF